MCATTFTALEQHLRGHLCMGVSILKHSKKLGLIALFKPAGVLSHPNKGVSKGRSILNLPYSLKTESFRCEQCEFYSQIHLLHRIDSSTSGILLISYIEDTAAKVKKLFAERLVEKKYVACCFGRLTPGVHSWRDFIETPKGIGRAVCSIAGRAAQGKLAETNISEKKWNYRKGISMIE